MHFSENIEMFLLIWISYDNFAMAIVFVYLFLLTFYIFDSKHLLM